MPRRGSARCTGPHRLMCGASATAGVAGRGPRSGAVGRFLDTKRSPPDSRQPQTPRTPRRECREETVPRTARVAGDYVEDAGPGTERREPGCGGSGGTPPARRRASPTAPTLQGSRSLTLHVSTRALSRASRNGAPGARLVGAGRPRPGCEARVPRQPAPVGSRPSGGDSGRRHASPEGRPGGHAGAPRQSGFAALVPAARPEVPGSAAVATRAAEAAGDHS